MGAEQRPPPPRVQPTATWRGEDHSACVRGRMCGVWRGQVAGDFLPNPKTVWGDTRVSIENDRILGVMGDGNCLYRALGVAMILHPRLIHRLLEVLRGLLSLQGQVQLLWLTDQYHRSPIRTFTFPSITTAT